MKNKAFTLIELLAVIMILGLVGLIAIPTVTKVIKNSKEKIYQSQIKMIETSAKKWSIDNITELSETEAAYVDLSYLISDGYIEQRELIDPRNTKNTMNGCIVIEYNNSYNAYDYEYVEDDCYNLKPKYADTTGAPIPELNEGMISILWDGDQWVKADISKEWYDYSAKEWANVVLVTESTRNAYRNASVGTPINEADVLAYLVWVPRYRYKLFNVEALSVSPQTIEIMFEDKETAKSNGSTNGTWLTHPAFTFGDSELSGIWVGKFKTTGDANTPTVKPNLSSLRNQNISTQFATSQKFNNTTIYGSTSNFDTHMMKSMDWGAATYLSHSIYGINGRIWRNNSSTYITGCAGNTASESSYSGCKNTYDTLLGVNASTTGNVYGIYDMAGEGYEYVMGAMYNSDNTTIYISGAGFSAATINSPNMLKYVNKYTFGTTPTDQAAFNRRLLGDAVGETRGWYGSTGFFLSNTSGSWFARGGDYLNCNYGDAYNYYAFRIVQVKP